jgi:NTE family protein
VNTSRPEPVLGLALGGGAARGLAHLGVVRALARSGIVPDVICGTSSGAIIGGALAAGVPPDELIEVALALRWSELIKPSPRRDRLFDTSGLDVLIANVIPAVDFGELGVSFASVAQDRVTGKRVLLKQGDPRRAAAASAAIRRAFPPVEIDGVTLVDGIGVDPFPTRAARELGATIVVAVDVLPASTAFGMRVRERHQASPARAADIVIRPSLGARPAWRFGGASEMIALGEEAAEDAVVAIHDALARIP